MTRLHGQILRLSGIFIEMLGVFALLTMTRTGPDGSPAPGAISQRVAWAIICAGFGVWAVGNAVIYWRRGDRAGRDRQGDKPRGSEDLGLRL
ncbi:hypothetical protein OJF2_20790 [Aquisphaera giovannonii]|uniref:Uncharacterized protein n=1 Tax=Aquisphaera giovannonii TaxID=406548 RepID=A0A5B9W000_9BACT|nr:hypothetical protein [Aquisphaera giovannonii]QEH33577.1 hypothetical protein OJF2_20790 [Aquisphaera giovannonii]